VAGKFFVGIGVGPVDGATNGFLPSYVFIIVLLYVSRVEMSRDASCFRQPRLRASLPSSFPSLPVGISRYRVSLNDYPISRGGRKCRDSVESYDPHRNSMNLWWDELWSLLNTQFQNSVHTEFVRIALHKRTSALCGIRGERSET